MIVTLATRFSVTVKLDDVYDTQLLEKTREGSVP